MVTTASATTPAIARRLRALERLIGNTPLLAIEYEVQGRKRTIHYAGSGSDRLPNRSPRL